MTEFSGLPNPFRDNVVQDAWQSPVDISDIHAGAFQACLQGIESASRAVPDSLLIYGSAGSGKTHLLSRLQRHLTETARSAPDNVLRCVFSFVRLQTSPLLLWQHVRRRLATDLMRREQGLTQLQRLVAHQVGVVAGLSPRAGVLGLRVLRAQDEAELSRHLQVVSMKLDLPRSLGVVLESLIFNRNVRDASAWLAGDSLPENVLEGLGLGPEPDEDREDTARHVVTALCRLAGETLPMVFCFDQVESLQRTAADEEALFRFGRVAADLHDADANVFLITCLQAAFLEQFKRAVRAADYDRVAQRTSALEHLTKAQVQSLVRSRLDALPALIEGRSEHPKEPFFPLSAALVDTLALETPCVPRRVLALAARGFDELQHGKSSPPPTTAEFLGTELESRQKDRGRALEPSDTQRIIVQATEVIEHLERAEVSNSDAEQADLVIRGERSGAVTVRNEADGRSLTPKLKALLRHVPRSDGLPVVVVRDARRPISKSAVKAREYLKSLHERGAALVEPSVEALAALDALASLIADSKSGDLANQEQQLETGAVLSWLKSLRGTLVLEPVEELVNALLGGNSALTDGAERDLADLLSHEHVVPVDLAARILNSTPEQVVDLAHRPTAHCLVLEGPPLLLLDVAGIVPETEAAP